MTIKDIARISGYGIGTVSRVINNQTGVSDAAREKILRVIEENGFEPLGNTRHWDASPEKVGRVRGRDPVARGQ